MQAKGRAAWVVTAVVAIGLTVAGCGQQAPVVPPTMQTGTLVIQVQQNGSVKPARAGQALPRLVPTEATNVRIRLIGGGFNRNIVEDAAFQNGVATLSLTVPVGTYEVHAVAYKLDTDGKSGAALTGGKASGVVVEEGKSTMITIELAKFGYTLEYPMTIQEGTDYTVRLYAENPNNGVRCFVTQGLEFDNDVRLIYSSQSWSGDTLANLPTDAQTVSMESSYYSGRPIDYWFRTQKASNEFGSNVYFQVRRPLSANYQNSANFVGGKTGLVPLYFYMPSVAYGEALGQIRVTPLGTVEIGLQ